MLSRKKWLPMIFILGLLCAGCGSEGGTAAVKSTKSQNAVDAVLEKQIAEENAGTGLSTDQVTTEEPATEEKTTAATTGKKTEAATETPSTSAAANDRYDPFEGIEQEYLTDPDPSVDVDLTAMTREMVYATVLQMLNVPEEYEGKKVKMSGAFYSTYYDVTDQVYRYVIIKDATACCSQGMEFVWDDGSHTDDEYPVEASEVEVTGVFESYKDPGDPLTYVHLKDSSMKVLKEAEENNTEISFVY